MNPAAVDRAEALVRHIRYLGAPPDQFVVCVSKVEGFELMAWFRSGQAAMADSVNLRRLDEDIEEALSIDDPWLVLQHFSLYGLPIVRIEELH